MKCISDSHILPILLDMKQFARSSLDKRGKFKALG